MRESASLSPFSAWDLARLGDGGGDDDVDDGGNGRLAPLPLWVVDGV